MKIDESVDDPRLLLEQFAEHTPDIFWMYTADWERLLFVNGSYEEIWGRPIDALEEDPTDFLAGIHPDYHETVRRDMERLSNGEAIQHEYRVNPGEDYERWVQSHGRPIYEDGELVRLAGFIRDITEQRRQEQSIRERERVIREIYEVTADAGLSFEERVERLLSIGCETLGTAYGTLSSIRGDDYVFEVVESPDDSIAAGDAVPLSATNCERTAATERTLV
jgi:PAS domain S-box-containing protein